MYISKNKKLVRWPGSFRLLLKCYIFQGLQEERVANEIIFRYI